MADKVKESILDSAQQARYFGSIINVNILHVAREKTPLQVLIFLKSNHCLELF